MVRTQRSVRTALAGALALSVTPVLPAQPANLQPPAVVVADADGVLGMGPGYSARVDRTGLQFVAAAAPRADAPRASLTWRLEAVGRRSAAGDWTPLTVRSAQRDATAIDNEVRVDRRTIVESYSMREEGVYVSYVLHDVPAGDGDLVLRIELETALTAPTDAGVDWPELQLGDATRGIHVGAVTGIDADGQRAAGWLRPKPGAIELVLPAEFVERASLPLVIDPLLSGSFGGYIYSPRDLRSAYGSAEDEYLVIAESYDYFCFCQRGSWQLLSSTGASTAGGSLGGGGHLADFYVVAATYVRGRDCFVAIHGIAFTPDLYASVIDAATRSITSSLLLPMSRVVGLAGESSDQGDRAFAAEPNGTITALEIDAAGAIRVVDAAVLAGANPKLARSGGLDDRFLAVWDGADSVEGVVFDRDLQGLDAGAVAPGRMGTTRAVAGDGRHWLVTYRDRAARQSVLVPVFWDSGAGQAYTGPETGQQILTPLAAFLGESYLIAERNLVFTVDPFTTATCETTETVMFGSVDALVSQRSADPESGEDALVRVGWRAQRFRAEDGRVANLGGGCLDRGWPAASCAVVGNGDFHLRLRDAPAEASVALALSTGEAPFSCGGCTLWPDLATGVLAPIGRTDPRGNAALPAPLPDLPSLLGAQFVAQWVVADGSGCPLGVDLSDALRVEVQ
ncbi:MAG: hypothetical protein AAF628_18090 [Planctomycetota bacterium]